MFPLPKSQEYCTEPVDPVAVPTKETISGEQPLSLSAVKAAWSCAFALDASKTPAIMVIRKITNVRFGVCMDKVGRKVAARNKLFSEKSIDCA